MGKEKRFSAFSLATSSSKRFQAPSCCCFQASSSGFTGMSLLQGLEIGLGPLLVALPDPGHAAHQPLVVGNGADLAEQDRPVDVPLLVQAVEPDGVVEFQARDEGSGEDNPPLLGHPRQLGVNRLIQ